MDGFNHIFGLNSYDEDLSQQQMSYDLFDQGEVVASRSETASSVCIHGYLEKDVPTKESLTQIYGDTGIIIPSSFYEEMAVEKPLTQPSLKFLLPVPIYNATNIAEAYPINQSNGEGIPCNYVTCEYVAVDLPVRKRQLFCCRANG